MDSVNRKRKSTNNENQNPKKVQKWDDSSAVSSLNVNKFASKRVIEIEALTDVVKDVGGNHQAFQKVPPHMRRRAMSHNIKRVPKRLHDLVKSELDKVKAASKRPSRKYRRKPINLLSEYEQRKRRIHWLDTHIWHAKRFKMVETWGYKLPLHPTDKSVRSCYRAVQRCCLLQDVSYEHYIEVKGKRGDIINGLHHLTGENTGPTVAAKMTSSGSKEGSLYLYNYDCYPYKVIGRVTYLWQSESKKDNSGELCSTLWIGCHPAFETETLRELEKCFDKKSGLDKTQNLDGSDNEVTKVNGLERDMLPGKECNVSVSCLKNEIVKFRLFGPASNLVLKETLSLWDSNELSKENKQYEKDDHDIDSVKKKGQEKDCLKEEMWWKSFYRSSERQDENDQQKKVWCAVLGCQSPAQVPPHLVMATTVRDPRLQLPPKRNKVSVFDAGNTGERLQPELFTSEVCASPLWDKGVRQNVKSTKIAEKALNDMRSKHFVPGTKLELGEQESRIPIILIQRPGLTDSPEGISSASSQHQIGYASGWDILLPAGWAMAFWVALVYRGARVGGQREAASIALQARQFVGVRDVPDSAAGEKELVTEALALKTKHASRPPAKRPNYAKLGFQFPFVFPFDQLCKEWLKKMEKSFSVVDYNKIMVERDMYVLRDRGCLKMLKSVLANPKNYSQPHKKKTKTQNLMQKFLDLMGQHGSAIVPVAVTVSQRGVPASHAHICIPSKEDFRKIRKSKNYGGPEEDLHVDEDAPRRKAERKERLKWRKKKKSGKTVGTNNQKSIVKDVEDKKAVPYEVSEKEYMGKVTEEANKSSDFINGTSRPIIGFLTMGDFDLGQGQGSGMGFCSLIGLLQLIEAQQTSGKACLALVRNPTSLQYRFVSISLVL